MLMALNGVVAATSLLQRFRVLIYRWNTRLLIAPLHLRVMLQVRVFIFFLIIIILLTSLLVLFYLLFS